MDLINNLILGFSTALSLANLLYAFFGVLIGTLIGVLPGIGPIATLAMLLPTTYALEPTSALIMLAGIYYGAQYGGSTTAILVNLPGRVVLGRHVHRRLPDGAPRPRRSGARDRGARIVLRRNGRHADPRRAAPARWSSWRSSSARPSTSR